MKNLRGLALPAAGLASVLVLAACSQTSQGGQTDPAPSKPGISSSANPAKPADNGAVETAHSTAAAWAYQGKLTDRASSIDPNVIPKDTIESGLFDQLPADQQANIKRMKQMSVEDFRKLPLDQQLLFDQFVYDNNAPHIMKNLERQGFDKADYVARLKLPSLDNSPQEIVDNSAMAFDVAMSLYENGSQFDTDTARKIAAMSISWESKEFQTMDQALLNKNKAPGTTSSSTTDLHGAKRYEANDATYEVVNTVTKGVDAQSTFKYLEFTDAWGQKRSAWQEILSIGPSSPGYETDLK